MPHIIIEYASDLVNELANDSQKQSMLEAVHQAVIESELFSVSNIKTRLVPINNYLVGNSGQRFIAVQCRIRPGRTQQQRRGLSEAILSTIRSQNWPVDVITVEVTEMELESYARYPAKS